MGINPGSDLLSDALAAADPYRANVAAQRLTAVAGGNPAPPSFEALLAGQQSTAQGPANGAAANGTGSQPAGAPELQSQPDAQGPADSAAGDETASPPPQAATAGDPKLRAAVAKAGAQNTGQGKASSVYRQFETTMLKTLFEAMLPQKADGIYGSGLAGSVWKSMYADALAQASSHAGILGIARNLEAKARHAAASNPDSART
jgi:hypothetical protein